MLTGAIEKISSLAKSETHDMYSLLARYYDATTYERFIEDLSRKDFALLLRDQCGVVRGFSTLEISRVHALGRDVRVAFSGDTIIERAYWGSHALAFSWLRHIGRQYATEPSLPMYWLLTVKGHRTYRYLPAFGIEFTPDWRRDNTELDAMKHALAAARFGENYDPSSSLLRYPTSKGHLTAEWAQPNERERKRADVQFFLQKNPGFSQGDELVCLCRISEDNMRPLTRRLFQQGADI